ncbi:hypothetical protein FRY98_20485 [Paenibacillus faecis]|uniref:DUF4367 domain-containing protein n=2 Tax=Paenibacillus TaxID=44249 RepID=A0A5D0CSI0_9BACL|nr:hypothetical protein FRY98_20485 [Paenibacillus faecis]
MAAAVLILTSITAYAGGYFVHIKNKEGEIILSVMEPQNYPVSAYEQKRREEAEAELKKILKPGQQAVYYIKDKRLPTSADSRVLYYYYEPIRHRSYADLAKDIEATGAPLLPEPSYVPEGYVLDHGLIQIQNTPLPNTPEYEKLWGELKERSLKSDEEAGLFYKIVPWSEPASTVLEYRKGERLLRMIAFARTKGSAVQVPSKQAVKLTVKGKEMILSSTSAEDSRKLSWLSESETVFYMISDDPQDPLSEEEFIQIAEGMIREEVK